MLSTYSFFILFLVENKTLIWLQCHMFLCFFPVDIAEKNAVSFQIIEIYFCFFAEEVAENNHYFIIPESFVGKYGRMFF